MIKDKRLLPCPFCGVVPEIAVCDDEGNIHDEEYVKDPWSGLHYKIVHHTEQPGAENCPIACYNDGFDDLGTQYYDSIDELLCAWNRRLPDTGDDEDDEEAYTCLSAEEERKIISDVTIVPERTQYTQEEIVELKKKYGYDEE